MGKPVDDQELHATQGRLLKLALKVYEDLMADSKDEVKKTVADKVLEMHGLVGKTGGPSVDFHLNIPPEYFGEVFRGLQRITVVAKELKDAEDVEVKEISDGKLESARASIEESV